MWKSEINSPSFSSKYGKGNRIMKVKYFTFWSVVGITLFGVIELIPVSSTLKTIETNETTANPITTTEYLPDGWDQFCTIKQQNQVAISFLCEIDTPYSGRWKFKEIAKFIKEKTLKYEFNIECFNGASVSIVWPMKAKNLVTLRVNNCEVHNYMTGHDKPLPDIPDQLEVFEFSNNNIIIDIADMIAQAANITSIKKDYDCGPEDTVRRMVFRNVTYGFAKNLMMMLLRNETDVAKKVMKLGAEMVAKTKEIEHKCIYKKLTYVDHSITKSKSRFNMELVTKYSIYPELTLYNISHSGIPRLEEQIKQWFINFGKLTTLDMSYNKITELDYDYSAKTWDVPLLTINLTHNLIQEIKVKDIDRLADVHNLYMDFSYNPINCSCSEETKELITFVKDEKKWSQPKYKRYSFIKDMTCHYPEYLENKKLKDLTIDDLECELELIERNAVEAIIVLSIFSVILIVIIIIILKFRREIRILTYTRFNIILPCQPMENFEKKRFDAFVSYSSSDQDWVTSVFDTQTTENQMMKNFKFCLHHKEFMPGKTIFENVIDSVEASRHTIIILSRTFLNSDYCMYEFHEAFQQSIIERKRHLVVIMMEDIPMSELPNDLKRCLKTFTYIRKDDVIFLDRLIYALSYKGRKNATSLEGMSNASFENQLSCETDTTEVESDGTSSPVISVPSKSIYPDVITEKDLVREKNEKNIL